MDISSLQDSFAEASILRILISDISKMADIGSRLSSKSFYSYSHQQIFKALRDLYMEEGVDDYGELASLVRRLGQIGELEKVGGISYITEMFKEYTNPSSLNVYITSVKEMEERRKLCEVCEDNMDKLMDKTISIIDIKSNLMSVMDEVMTEPGDDTKNGIKSAYDNLLSDEQHGLDTGYRSIDNILHGIRKGNLVVLAGRPSMGKTALAINIMANLCRKHSKILLYSLEMSTEEIGERLLLCEAELTKGDIRKSKGDEKIIARLDDANRRIANWDMRVVEENVASVEDLIMDACSYQKAHGVDMVIIDYLQLMSAKGYKDNRVNEISHITRSLKLLAKRIDAPILVLSQLSRKVEERGDKKPLPSDLRESGSIEQDADIILMMYRDKYYNENGDEWTEVNVAKHRQGRIGVARLTFDMERSRFSDYKGIAGKKVKRSDAKDVREFFNEG